MKKLIVATAAFAVALAALRRFAPELHERGMKKCHEMMTKCQEKFARQAGAPEGTARMSATTAGTEQAASDERERAVAAPGS